MTESFKIEIISPDKLFYNSENVNEVVVPAVEGDMGILKNHISIISFMKPGIIKVLTDNSEDEFYVEDGILEFKDNTLSILTSSIFNLKDKNKDFISKNLEEAEKQLQNNDLDDQMKFLLSQKIDILKLIN